MEIGVKRLRIKKPSRKTASKGGEGEGPNKKRGKARLGKFLVGKSEKRPARATAKQSENQKTASEAEHPISPSAFTGRGKGRKTKSNRGNFAGSPTMATTTCALGEKRLSSTTTTKKINKNGKKGATKQVTAPQKVWTPPKTSGERWSLGRAQKGRKKKNKVAATELPPAAQSSGSTRHVFRPSSQQKTSLPWTARRPTWGPPQESDLGKERKKPRNKA